MEEIIADYIISASHLDRLRASRGDVGAVLSAHHDPPAVARPNDAAPRPSHAPQPLLPAAGGGGGGIHRRIETELDGMRCRSAVLRRAVAEHEAPAQRKSLSRSLRIRPGHLHAPELLRGSLLSPTHDRPASWAGTPASPRRSLASTPARPRSAVTDPTAARTPDPGPGPGRDFLQLAVPRRAQSLSIARRRTDRPASASASAHAWKAAAAGEGRRN